MSKATKRKHVAREVMEDYVEPDGDQEIVKILGGQGNNLHKIVTADGENYLASMPTKFRRNVWIKRGDFVIVEPIAEGDRVRAEIVHILYPKQVKYLCQENLWPKTFQVPYLRNRSPETKKETTMSAASHNNAAKEEEEEEEYEESSDDDSDLFVNTNRPPVYEEEDDDDDDDEDEHEEEEDEGE